MIPEWLPVEDQLAPLPVDWVAARNPRTVAALPGHDHWSFLHPDPCWCLTGKKKKKKLARSSVQSTGPHLTLSKHSMSQRGKLLPHTLQLQHVTQRPLNRHYRASMGLQASTKLGPCVLWLLLPDSYKSLHDLKDWSLWWLISIQMRSRVTGQTRL